MLRRTLLVAVAIGVLMALGAPTPASAQKPPKSAAIFDGDVGPTTGGVAELASLTLRRFKKNRILRLEVSLDVDGDFGGEVAVLDGVAVNGRFVPFESTNCTNTACVITRSTFVDLDTLAAAFPDDFKGEPLVISIYGRAEWVGPPFARRLRALAYLLRK